MRKKNVLLNQKTILITGAAGFIGANLAMTLFREIRDITVIGFDNCNDYYDVSLKKNRLSWIERLSSEIPGSHWEFVKGDLSDKSALENLFRKYHFDIVVNLAAQAGVRYSIDNPDVYIESNIIGFYHMIEVCRRYGVKHLVYASSSSVYGSNSVIPFCVEDKTEQPVSLYAATKKSNELLAYTYSALYGVPATGLRFFTVYGPAGRPDMAYFKFTNQMLKGESVSLFNYGNCARDFTYIDDAVQAIINVMQCAPEEENTSQGLPIPPYRIYNIGNSKPENLLVFCRILAEELMRIGLLPADYHFEEHSVLLPMQPGDVPVTYADVSALEADFGYCPSTPLRKGIAEFLRWYKEYYQK